MTAKGIMKVYPGRSFYITIANFGKVDSNLYKNQNVGGVANVIKVIMDIWTERFSYRSGARQLDSTAPWTSYTTRLS